MLTSITPKFGETLSWRLILQTQETQRLTNWGPLSNMQCIQRNQNYLLVLLTLSIYILLNSTSDFIIHFQQFKTTFLLKFDTHFCNHSSNKTRVHSQNSYSRGNLFLFFKFKKRKRTIKTSYLCLFAWH